MAISTPSALGAVYDLTNAANTVLPAAGSVTLVAGQLYILRYGCDRNLGAPDLSTGYTITHGATDKTSSWTLIGVSPTFGASGTSRQMVALWYIPPSTEAGITITFDPAGGTNLNNMVELLEVASGFHPTAPIKQFAYALTSGSASGSVALAGVPDADSICLSFWHTYLVTAGAVVARSGWTELSNITGSGVATDSGALESQYDLAPSPEQTASCSTAGASRDWMGLILEIDAAPTGPTSGCPMVGVGPIAVSASANVTASYPAGYTPTAGHFGLATVVTTTNNGSNASPAAPAGWTARSQNGGFASGLAMQQYYRFIQAGDTAPVFVIPAACIDATLGGMVVQLSVYNNVDPVNPFDVTDQPVGNPAGGTLMQVSIFAMTTATAKAKIIVTVASDDDNAISLSSPAGFTDEVSGAGAQTTTGGDKAMAIADLEKTTPGPVTLPDFTQTANSPDNWLGWIVALRPVRAQVSGTVTVAITEADVQAGSKTIIITLGGGLQWIPT